MRDIECIVTEDHASIFFHLLRKGVGCTCRTGSSIRCFLSETLGLTAEEAQCKIKTIFLDNSPVDDPDTTCIPDGSVLALGTAMPGLVGITMACSSPFSGFRDDISHVPRNTAAPSVPNGHITLKLFSFVADMCGRRVLSKGVDAPVREMARFFKDNQTDLTKHLVCLRMDGELLPLDALLTRLSETAQAAASAAGPPLVRLTCREEKKHGSAHPHTAGD